MARILEFRIPEGFKTTKQWTPVDEYGKLLQFAPRPLQDPNAPRMISSNPDTFVADVPVLRQIPIL